MKVEPGGAPDRRKNQLPVTYPGSLARNILCVFGVAILAAGAARAEQGPVFYHKRLRIMAKGEVTRRQKDISRLLREKKRIPPPERIRKERKEKKK